VPTTSGDVRPLASLPPGAGGTLGLGRVVRAHGLRLAQLGLRAGAQVTVLGRTAGGGRVIGVGSTRIGVDRETSRRLEVLVPGVLA
jgi:ferrous iron transport protein A